MTANEIWRAGGLVGEHLGAHLRSSPPREGEGDLPFTVVPTASRLLEGRRQPEARRLHVCHAWSKDV
jgi:hypothetical protein